VPVDVAAHNSGVPRRETNLADIDDAAAGGAADPPGDISARLLLYKKICEQNLADIVKVRW
jgi:hypothetical protein